MSLRKKIELDWNGKEYSLLVTMEVIDRVEDKISVGKLLARQSVGDVRFSHIAKFVSIVLNEAGADTTQEEVYLGMFAGGDQSIEHVSGVLFGSIISAFFPEQKKKEHLTPTRRKKAPAKS